MAHIQQLPEEILRSILNLVGAANGEDLLSMRLVCRQWKVIALKATKLQWRIYNENDAAALVSFLSNDNRKGVELESLSLVFSQEALTSVPAKLFAAGICHSLPLRVCVRTSGAVLSGDHCRQIMWSFDEVPGTTLDHGDHEEQSLALAAHWKAWMGCNEVRQLQIHGRYETLMLPLTKSCWLTKLRLVKMEIGKGSFEALVSALTALETLEWEDLVHPKVQIVLRSNSVKHISGKEEFLCKYRTYHLKIVARSLLTLDIDYGLLNLEAPRLEELDALVQPPIKQKLSTLCRLTLRGDATNSLNPLLESLTICPHLQVLDIAVQDYPSCALAKRGLSAFMSSLPPRLQVLHLDKGLLSSLVLENVLVECLKSLSRIQVYNLFVDDESFLQVYANLRMLVKWCPALRVLELGFVVESEDLGAVKSLVGEDFKGLQVAVFVQR